MSEKIDQVDVIIAGYYSIPDPDRKLLDHFVSLWKDRPNAYVDHRNARALSALLALLDECYDPSRFCFMCEGGEKGEEHDHACPVARCMALGLVKE